MKIILKLVILFALASNATAQIPVGTFTVNNRAFIAEPSNTTYSDGSRRLPNFMYIKAITGSFNGLPSTYVIPDDCAKAVLAYEKNPSKIDCVRYFDILRSVFSATRCNSIFNTDNAVIGMIGIQSVFQITVSGIVTDVYFTVSESTIITPQEIDLLYTRLIAQMSFTIPDNNCITNARFVFPDRMDFMEQFGVIHTEPFFFGNGSRWAGR